MYPITSAITPALLIPVQSVYLGVIYTQNTEISSTVPPIVTPLEGGATDEYGNQPTDEYSQVPNPQ